MAIPPFKTAMNRNSIWILSGIFLLIVVGATLHGLGPKIGITSPIPTSSSHDKDTLAIERNGHSEDGDSAAPQPSRRYANDEIRRKERGAIERMIVAQEKLVADKKKEVSVLVRTRGIVFSPEDNKLPKTDDALPREGDDFVKAKMALDKELQILERLNDKLASIRD